MIINITVSTISAISWRQVLLVDESGGSGENHRPATTHMQCKQVKYFVMKTSYTITNHPTQI